MSISKFVVSLLNTLIGPPVSVPAGPIAWFPTTPPIGAFRVDTIGSVCCSAQVVMYTSGPKLIAVIRVEYTSAVDGIPQELCCTGKLRVDPASRAGGPNRPLNPNPLRVSTTRQGATA